MSDRPFMKFYPSDWRGSTSLKLVSMAARGLWIEMLCIMHEAEPYGHLLHKGRKLDASSLAVLVSAPVSDVESWLAELEAFGVADRKRSGVLFSKRMEADEIKRGKNRDNGKKGGNPSLRKDEEIPGSVNPKITEGDKAQRPETRDQRPEDSSFQSESAREDDFGDMFGGSLPVPAKPKREKRTPTHLPKDWQPSDEDRAFAESEGMTEAQTDREAQRFKDHWKTTAKNATKADWPATWRNWIRRIIDDPKWKSANGRGEPAWRIERAQSFEDIQAAAIKAAHQRSSGG